MEKHGSGTAADEAQAVADKAASHASGVIETARRFACEKTEELAANVRARPVASVLIALGAGYILGSLRRR